MFQISLIAAFVAGMVALFAPCCISYLFPAYIANIFKEKEKVILMTLIYSLGIFTVMMPVVLGARILTEIFMDFHDKTYIIGGFIMILSAFLTLIGFKLPMININKNVKKKNTVDVTSTYLLGIVSGVTSSCCAPVLIGVITLSSFSPSLLFSFLIGFTYVLGMVFPLYIAALFIDKKNILSNPILKKNITSFVFLDKKRNVTLATLIGSIIFFISGLAMILLTLSGKLSMPAGDDSVTKSINNVAFKVTNATNTIPLLNEIVFILLISLVIYLYLQTKKPKKEKMKQSCCNTDPKEVD